MEAYVAEGQLAEVLDRYQLERDERGDLQLRSLPEPWPFPPHARVVPALVAALDLAESIHAALAELGTTRLCELAVDVVADWQQRPPRRRPIRPVIPTGAPVQQGGHRRPSATADDLWDDRAEQDARQLVAVLFVAATPLRRAEVAGTLRLLARALRGDDVLAYQAGRRLNL